MGNLSYGSFTADGREYILTRPDTPRPWHNFLYNDLYLVNINQLGTGASFYSPRGEGLRANLTEDRDGSGGARLVYLRDDETGDYHSLTGAPDLAPLDHWQTRIGLGYQIMSSEKGGIAAEWRVFVPPGSDRCELWTITLTNRSDRDRTLSAYPYVEMHLTGGSTLMDFIAVLGGKYRADQRAVYGINNCVAFPGYFKGVLAADRQPEAVTVSRDEFLGHYRDYRNPLAVERGDVHNEQAGTEWVGASHRHTYTLAPGESATLNLLLGIVDDEADGGRLIEKYLAAGVVEQTFKKMIAAQESMLGCGHVSTPSAQLNRWSNVWLKRQLDFVGSWGRVIGRGYRDVLQDTFGLRIIDPVKARANLKEVFAKQFSDGKCIRAWRLPNAQLDLQDYADSPSWMIMAISMYLKETGDFALLGEEVDYLNHADPYAEPTVSGTMWEHLVRAQRWLLTNRGQKGLVKIYHGDWCDTMNGVGKRGEGVSVMLSMQTKWGCDQLAELCEYIHAHGGCADDAEALPALAEEMKTAARELSDAINANAWDEQGDYFIRAFDDDGVPVGSSTPPADEKGELKIFLNPQSWSVISGVADAGRAEQALQAVEPLETGYGKVLSWPQSTFLKPRLGQMSAMTPGFYENGSVYVHGHCFWTAALAMAGRGEQAVQSLLDVLPDTDNKPNTDTEPFVIPNMYIGPVVERRMQRSLYLSGWRTGSAAWLFYTVVEWIIGARAEYAGLKIDPHLPADWPEVSIVRPFRGATYRITIRRAGPGDAVRSITLDGQPIEGDLIPPADDTGEHHVEVALG